MPRRIKTLKSHLSERLRTPEAMAAFLNAALKESKSAAFLLALRYAADLQGIGKVAADAKLNRENVYRMLSEEGNPTFSSLKRILHVLGMTLRIELETRTDEIEASLVVGTVVPKLQGSTVGDLQPSTLPEQLQPRQDEYQGDDHESIIPADDQPLAA